MNKHCDYPDCEKEVTDQVRDEDGQLYHELCWEHWKKFEKEFMGWADNQKDINGLLMRTEIFLMSW